MKAFYFILRLIASPIFLAVCLAGFLIVLIIVFPATFVGRGDSWNDRLHIIKFLVIIPFKMAWTFIKEGVDFKEFDSLNLDGTEEE